MPASLSIVIPTLNAASKIGPTLASLHEGIDIGLIKELIITDGGSVDEIKIISEEIGAIFISGDAGRGTQLHNGALKTNAPWILFIHADTILSKDWPNAAFEHITKYKDAGYCKLAFDDNGFMPKIISLGANLRSHLFGLPYGDQCLLISRELYNEIGGYLKIPLMEDVAMAKALKGRLRVMPIKAITSSERYRAEGWITRSIKNIALVIKFIFGWDPGELANFYKPKN